MSARALEKVSEHAAQKTAADVLSIEIGPAGKVSPQGVTWFAIDHANFGGKVPGARVGRGVVAGIPDFIIMHAGRSFWVEYKPGAASVLSNTQREMIVSLLATNLPNSVAATPEQILDALDTWGIPRKRLFRGSQRAA